MGAGDWRELDLWPPIAVIMHLDTRKRNADYRPCAAEFGSKVCF